MDLHHYIMLFGMVIDLWNTFSKYSCLRNHLNSAGHEEVIDLLIKRGASIDHVDKRGMTALQFAVNRGT